MSELTDKQIDKIIKNSMQEDTKISDKANSVFDSFLNADNLNKIAKENNLFAKAKEEKVNKNSTSNKNAEKVIEIAWYTRLNRVLSVAAVSLGVLLIGGAALYYYNPKQNNSNSNTVVVEKKYMIKNEEMQVENEKVTKEAENKYVKVTLIGNTDIAVQFKSEYWNQYDDDFSSDKFYKVENINQNVKDIFIGEIGNGRGTAYIFVLLEDGTAQYINLYEKYNNEFYYCAQDIQGLYDVVGFEQGKRNFFHSEDEYGFVNAIKNDGTTKEIELHNYNSWGDKSTKEFDRLNQKYIDAYNGKSFANDNSGDFNVDNSSYLELNNQYYCYKDCSLYKVTNSGLDCLAINVGGFCRSEFDRISVYVDEHTVIYKLDDNIIFRNYDETIVNEVTNNSQEFDVESYISKQEDINSNLFSDFERKIKNSGVYIVDSLGHYNIQCKNDTSKAYSIQNDKLFRWNISEDSYSWLATGVNDIEKDEKGNLICKLNQEYSIEENDSNIIFKEYDVSDEEIVSEVGDENIKFYTRSDRSITVQISKNGLKELGINYSDTNIKENIQYNLYAKDGFSYNEKGEPFASAELSIYGTAGKTNRLIFAYSTQGGKVVCIDVVDAIKNNKFKYADCSSISNCSVITYLSIGVKDFERNPNNYSIIYIGVSDKNGNQIGEKELETPYDLNH